MKKGEAGRGIEAGVAAEMEDIVLDAVYEDSVAPFHPVSMKPEWKGRMVPDRGACRETKAGIRPDLEVSEKVLDRRDSYTSEAPPSTLLHNSNSPPPRPPPPSFTASILGGVRRRSTRVTQR